jgi:hypothetical protein
MDKNNRIRPDVPLTDAGAERVEERRMVRDTPPSVASPFLVAIPVVVLLVAGGLYFWPRDMANTSVTHNAPRIEQPKPATTPTNRPTPTPPTEAPK